MNVEISENHNIKAVLFDFGGVLAEEGFREGMSEIARKNEVPLEEYLKYVFQVIYDIGFTLGKVKEDIFWQKLRDKFGITGSDQELSEELLSRFILRPYMIDIVKSLSSRNISVSILSDQTTWLDELNRRYHFYDLFDQVFNSYYLGITKKDPEIFNTILKKINHNANEVIFIDDYQPHIDRAKSMGLNTILYKTKSDFLTRLNNFFPDII